MTWQAPATAVTGDIITAAFWNTNGRDNLNETAPAKVTTAGDLVYATGANALARLALGPQGRILTAGASAPAWGRLEAAGVGVLPSCRLRRNSDQTILTASWTTVTFDTELWDPLNMHDPANPERIGIPVSGRYLIDFRVAFANNANGIRQARVLDDSAALLLFREETLFNAGYYTFLGDVAVGTLYAGSYLYLQVYQTSGGDLASKADASLLTPRLGVVFLGAES